MNPCEGVEDGAEVRRESLFGFRDGAFDPPVLKTLHRAAPCSTYDCLRGTLDHAESASCRSMFIAHDI